MARIVVTEFVSLDGVMEEPRWTFQFDRGKDGDAFKYDELFACSALLLGRVTYAGFASAWPAMGQDDFGRRMNEIPKYVVSATLADADATWGPTTVIRSDVAAEMARLKVEHDGDLLHWFYDQGLVPGQALVVESSEPAADQVVVRLDDGTRSVSEKAAAGLFVRPL